MKIESYNDISELSTTDFITLEKWVKLNHDIRIGLITDTRKQMSRSIRRGHF